VRIAIAIAALVSVSAAAAAAPPAPRDVGAFRTPDGAIYCNLGFCFRTSDGFYVSIDRPLSDHPAFSKGYDARYKGYRNERVEVLPYGQARYSSDAEVLTCWSRPAGVTCKHYEGLSFFLGRRKDHRFFVDPPGRPPDVTPLFRTPLGAYCGILLSFGEKETLLCWTPRDGLALSIDHSQRGRGSWGRDEQLKGHRPGGFPVLPAGREFAWRCRKITAPSAECSTTQGRTVFTCSTRADGLTCRNRLGHGFWVGRERSFDVF
jgi:hypothetical protein